MANNRAASTAPHPTRPRGGVAKARATETAADQRTCAKKKPHRAQAHAAQHDALALLGISGSRGEVLRYLAVHPEERMYLRHLERLFGSRSASLQRDLRDLTQLGAVRRIERVGGRRVEYEVVPSWPLWRPLRQMIAALSDPSQLAREAFRGVMGVDAAFIYGSFAKGTAQEDSDVDVFVVGEAVDRTQLHRALSEVALLTGREVNPNIYTPATLRERLSQPASASRRFLRDVLMGPKQWVVGTPETLEPLATAAGVVCVS